MLVLACAAAFLSALLHVAFFCMESLWWTRPWVVRAFRSTQERAHSTRYLALNQGFYNLFLAAGTLIGLLLLNGPQRREGMLLVTWNCVSMLGAALVLLGSSKGTMLRGALIQGLPPLLALLALWTAQ